MLDVGWTARRVGVLAALPSAPGVPVSVLTELSVAFGRVVVTSLLGSLKTVVGTLELIAGSEEGGEEAERSEEEPLYGLPGFYFRPKPQVKSENATPNNPPGECEVVAVRLDDRAFPLAYLDRRIAAKLNPKEGEVGVAQYQGGFVALKDNATADGTDVTIYAVHNDGSGVPDKAHLVQLDSTTANSSITLLHSFGHAISLDKDGNIVLRNKDSDTSVVVKQDGTVVINAANISLNGGVMAGDKNPANGQFVALANLVFSELSSIQAQLTAHTHGGVTAGAANTGASSSTYVASPVAATLVKAK